MSHLKFAVGIPLTNWFCRPLTIFLWRSPRFCCVWKLLCWRLLNVRPATWKVTFCLSLFYFLCLLVFAGSCAFRWIPQPNWWRQNSRSPVVGLGDEAQSQSAWERQEVSGRRQPSFA